MHFVFQISSCAGKSARGVCRLLNDKILEAGLSAKVLSVGGEDYFIVSASEERLRSEATTLSRLEHETAFFFSRTEYGVESSRDSLNMALTTREEEQLLRSVLDSIKVTGDDLDALRWVDINPKDFTIGDSLFGALFTHTEIFTDSFPLHEDTEMPSLRAEIFSVAPPCPNAVRACFGSKIALYFAFLRTLNLWLVALGIAAVLAEATIYAYGISSSWTMLYGCSVSVWSALFLKYWGRQDAALIFEWEFGKLKSDTHALRWQLRGAKRMFQATGKAAVFNVSQTVKRHLAATVPLVAALLLPSTIITLISLNLEDKLSSDSPWHWPAVVNFGQRHLSLDTPFGRALLSGASAVVMYFVNRVYSKYCVVMSKWEGWSTEEEFAASLALKRLPFELVTFFLSPVVRAVWGPTAAALRIELTGVLLGDFAARIFTEVLWPRFLYAKRQWNLSRRKSSGSRPLSALAERVQAEAELPKIEFFDGYCLYVRYYIIVTCFASVFPMGAVLCLAMMWFESKASLYCLLRFRKRAPGMRATNIGVWLDVLRFVSMISISFNCFLQAHTTGQIVAVFANFAALHSIGAYGIAFAIEQLMRLTARLISALVPDMPRRVRESDTKEKREMAARRWAEIHKQHESTGSTRNDSNNKEAPSHVRPPVAQLSARTEALPSLSEPG